MAEADNNHEVLDIQLITLCDRFELFELIKTNPKYYLSLIKKHKLEDQLMIKINNDPSNYTIKFKIYPNDRWIEVGYFNDSSVNENDVFTDFVKQIDFSLASTDNTNSRAHLSGELDQNVHDFNNYAGINFERRLETKEDILATKLSNNLQNRTGENMNDNEEIETNNGETETGEKEKEFDVTKCYDKLQRKLIAGYNTAILAKLKKYVKISNALGQINVVPSRFSDVHASLIEHYSLFTYMFKLLTIFNDNYHEDGIMRNIDLHEGLRSSHPQLYDSLSAKSIFNAKDQELIAKYQYEFLDLVKLNIY